MSNNKHFADLLKVCSILPALAIMPAMAEVITLETDTEILNQVIENQTITGEKTGIGGVLSYKASKGTTPSLTIKNSQFKNNTRYDVDTANGAYGAALSASGVNVVMENVDFIGNRADTSTDVKKTAKSQGAAYYQGGASFDATGLTVKANETTGNTTGIGTGLFLWGVTSGSLSNSTFENNIAKGTGERTVFESNGGALVLWANGERFNVYNTTFSGNKVLSAANGGGAVSTKGAVTYNNVTFTKNEAIGSDYGNGGAMEVYYSNGDATQTEIEIIDSDFESNYASTAGGAIWNASNVKSLVIEGTDFENNESGETGGAIWNAGNLTVNKSDFDGNIAKSSGGAIYNQGALTLNYAEFKGNSVTAGDGGAIRIDVTNGAKTVIKDSEFSENKALGYASADSGAISIRNGDVKIADSEFDKNEAMFGGAMYLYTGNNHYVSVDINETKFEENKALAGGAIVSVASNKNNENGGLRLTDVKFNANNASDNEGDGGGALFLGAQSQTYITRGVFNGNTSAAAGGAISMRDGDSGNNKDAKLDIVDSVFANNEAATQGGAIYSTFYNSVQEIDNVYLDGSSFVNNKANEGGAIYNEGNADLGNNFASMKLENVSFVGNTATDKGGAIFNGAGGTINMSGDNTFENNVAGKGANDIFNDGVLNITGGTTLIGGGIVGNGTLTLAEGATLDIANTTVKQSEININGTVALSILSNRSYGRLIADDGKLNVSDTAKLQLSVGGVGEYNIFDGNLAGFKNITYGESYLVEELDNGYIKVTTKSVEDLAADTGLTTQAAGAVAALANSRSDKVQHISLVFQEALNSGNKELIEQESKKLNPEDKPVAQSVASSVQNQVLSLATGRMAGGVAMGRAGGDESQENGFWMHGLFNKSKLNDQFHGYTRGVAFGMDTVIDGKYTLGGGLAFNNSDVHSDGRGAVDIDSKTLFVYGQYKPNKWFANMALTYTLAEYDEETSVAGYVLSDRYDVDSYGAQIMGGYDFNTGITTEAGLRYLHIAQDEYTKETGAQVAATSTDLLTSVAGLKYSFAIENDWAIKLQPELRAALTYDLISEADAAVIDMPGVASYAVEGKQMNRLGGEFGIGLTADYQGLKVTLMYDLDLHKDYTSQTGMIKFRTQF